MIWACVVWFLLGVITALIWVLLALAGVFTTQQRDEYED